MRYNNRTLLKDHLRLDIWYYNNLLINNGFIFHQIKRNEGFNWIVFIAGKRSVLPSLYINDKNTTSFMFYKIDSINVKRISIKRKMLVHILLNSVHRQWWRTHDKELWNGLHTSANDSKIFANLLMLNTLNIPTARRFKKDKQYFVRYIMMYPCHQFLCIYDSEIISNSGSTCNSKYETNQSIHDPRTWKYITA